MAKPMGVRTKRKIAQWYADRDMKRAGEDAGARYQKAQKNRLRKYVCDCGQIIRGTRNTLVLCGLCHEMTGQLVMMRRADPLPEEIGMVQVS